MQSIIFTEITTKNTLDNFQWNKLKEIPTIINQTASMESVHFQYMNLAIIKHSTAK